MEYRELGRTGIRVSEIGYGAWGIGGGGGGAAQEDESVRALHAAIEAGVTFIDTARGYGESEREVSTVIVGMRSVRNVERNAALSDGRRISDEQRAVLDRHRWERNFYLPA
jgi:aryl-alcohol dehydrogenase-like predicted oxidoreductase